MELQEDDVAVAPAEEMKPGQRTPSKVERPVGLCLQAGRELGLFQIGRVVPYQFVVFGRQQCRDGTNAVAREDRPQILVVKNDVLEDLIDVVIVDVWLKGHAGGESIG